MFCCFANGNLFSKPGVLFAQIIYLVKVEITWSKILFLQVKAVK